MRMRRLIALSVFSLLMMISGVALAQQESVTHTVQYGDTLYRIALRYGTTVSDLAAANEITDVTRIYSGQTLVIPGLEPAASSENVENPLVAPSPILHTVTYGDTLLTIANRYGTSVNQILQANNISNIDLIYAGQQLQIWPPDMAAPVDELAETIAPDETGSAVEETPEVVETVAEETPESTEEVEVASTEEEPVEEEAVETVEQELPDKQHLVRRGEYLTGIARQYGIAWTTIAEANGILNPNNIYAGMTLTIPGIKDENAVQTGILDPDEIPMASQELIDNHPGPRVGVGREFVVILSTQMAYAYEDGELYHASLISSGLPATPTVRGDYKIYMKYDSQTMSGPGYYLPGVESVMYFYQGYAFHGTYWHTNFGQPMSHGCVNMNNTDARIFFDFGEIGTPVHVRYEV